MAVCHGVSVPGSTSVLYSVFNFLHLCEMLSVLEENFQKSGPQTKTYRSRWKHQRTNLGESYFSQFYFQDSIRATWYSRSRKQCNKSSAWCEKWSTVPQRFGNISSFKSSKLTATTDFQTGLENGASFVNMSSSFIILILINNFG